MKGISILICCVGISLANEEAMREAIRLLDSGDAKAARLAFQGLADQGETEAFVYLGRIAFEEEDWEGAIALFQKALPIENKSSTTHHWLGKAYLEKLKRASMMQKGGLAKSVLNHYQKAIELDESNLDARESMAYFRYNAHPLAGGSKAKAKREAQEIASRDPVRGGLLLAGFLRGEKEYLRALETYDAVLAQDPDALTAHFQKGQTLQALERIDAATSAFEQVLRLEPDHEGGLYCVGRNSAISGKNLERGATCLRRYLELEPRPGYPSKAAAHWRLGMIYQAQGHLDRAGQSFREAVRLDPEDASFREALEKLEAFR